MNQTVALVTGANRGIGVEICRQLARRGIKVILTARNMKKGEEAAQKLVNEGLNVTFLHLDVTDEESIRQAVEFVEKNQGRLDILINNAGIQIDIDIQGINADINKIKESMETNVYGPLRIIKAFIPLMRKNNTGKIINISSRMASLKRMKGGAPGYRISKTALNAVTRIVATELAGTNITVNSVSPGHVRTGMGGPNAPQSVEEGADTTVWLATSEIQDTGKVFSERQEFEW